MTENRKIRDSQDEIRKLGRRAQDDAPFYEDANVMAHINEKSLDLSDLSLSDLLAIERTDLAQRRNSYALKRTMMAAERTYAAWVRTGFSVASAGVAIAELLAGKEFAFIVGGLLLSIGLFAFVFGWTSYYRTFKLLKNETQKDSSSSRYERINFLLVTLNTILLFIACLVAYGLVLYLKGGKNI